MKNINGIRITNFNKDKVLKILKKGICTISLTAVMATTFTGCFGPSINEKNNANYNLPDGETYFSSIQEDFCDDDFYDLPETIETIDIKYNYYISDLSDLPTLFPNLKKLVIDNCPSIDDLSFLYEIPNLEEVSLKNCAFITEDLIKNLINKGIKVNASLNDLEAAKKVDNIIKEIITDDMTDEEKIQAITIYVIDNYKYKITKFLESNDEPLTSMFENKGGVCASYAYLVNVLLRKAGIESYEIISDIHAWNVIQLDGKFYYLDATNIDQIPILSKFMLKQFNVGLYYMTDPKATSFSAMNDYDNVEKVLIPDSLIEDIKAGQSEKNIFEKYGNSVPARVIEILIIVLSINLGFKMAGLIGDNLHYKKRRRRRRRR